MFDRILVPLDGSQLAECVLPHLLAIARPGNSQVFLLRVLEPLINPGRPRAIDPVDWQIRKSEAEVYLDSLAEQLRKYDLQVSCQMQEGRPAENIIEYARQMDTDLILISSHGMSGISAWNVSSVVQQVIARVHRSVMIVRAYQASCDIKQQISYKKIFVPLDGSPRAEVSLQVARSLASQAGGSLLLAHVVRRPELPRRTPPSQEDLQLVSRLTERNHEEAKQYLDELRQRLGGQAQVVLEVSEKVASTLHQIAEQQEVDLVILSAHGYSGETRWPYGSVVVSFIAYGSTPMIVLQDLPADRIEPTRAEIAARQKGGR